MITFSSIFSVDPRLTVKCMSMSMASSDSRKWTLSIDQRAHSCSYSPLSVYKQAGAWHGSIGRGAGQNSPQADCWAMK
jgi:hypothetical protein